MNADFLSGLLLVGVLLAGAGYLIKAFFWESFVEFYSAQKTARENQASAQPAGTNDHLVGASGRIVDDGAHSGKLRVRVGMESWHARPADATTSLPVGTEVEVHAVDGRVLEVAPKTAAGGTEASAG